MPRRFIQELSNDTIKLLQKVYKVSKRHQVRQRAQCILLSYQGYTTNELAHIYQVDRVTIYNWFNAWESRHFAGLYDKKGRGRNPSFNETQEEQIRQWVKLHPKNLNKVIAFIEKEFGFSTSKSTITDRSFKRPFRPDAATARLRWRPLLAHAASGCPSTR
jgi:transposase